MHNIYAINIIAQLLCNYACKYHAILDAGGQTVIETPTPTFTPLPTLTPPAYAYMTIGESGQTVLFEYSATPADVVIVFLLAALLFSIWVFGLVWLRIRR